MSKIIQATKELKSLLGFISPVQLTAIGNGFRSEEKDFFFDVISDIFKTVTTMPKTYETDGQGDSAIAYLHYFIGGMDWYITERDLNIAQLQAFGYADLGMGGGELGYISIHELRQNNVEIDFHWTPKTIGEIKQERG